MCLLKEDKAVVPANEMRLMCRSVYCEALDNISSLIEHRFCSGTGSFSCHINLTPCVPLNNTSRTSRFVSLGLETVLYIVHSLLHLTLLYVHEHLQRDSSSGLAGVVSGHTGLIIPPDVIFMFGSCTGGENGYFPKCLLLISADEKSRLWRECGVTCQSKPTET